LTREKNKINDLQRENVELKKSINDLSNAYNQVQNNNNELNNKRRDYESKINALINEKNSFIIKNNELSNENSELKTNNFELNNDNKRLGEEKEQLLKDKENLQKELTTNTNLGNNTSNINPTNGNTTMTVPEVAKKLLNLCSNFKIRDNLKDLSVFFETLLNEYPENSYFKFYYAASIDKEELLQDQAKNLYEVLLRNSKNLQSENLELYIWTLYNLGFLYYKSKLNNEAKQTFQLIKDNYYNKNYYGKFNNGLIEDAIKFLDFIEKGIHWEDAKNDYLGKKKKR